MAKIGHVINSFLSNNSLVIRSRTNIETDWRDGQV